MEELTCKKSHLKKILIHHHAVAYEENEHIWVQSFIGQWVEDLSIYFEEIGLLLYKSHRKLTQQDFCIQAKNVVLVPLGYSRTGHWLDKLDELRKTCISIGNNYNTLLIRGITPYQFQVFKYCPTQYKFYLLVGSLKDNKPKIGFGRGEILKWILNKRRLYELRLISKRSQMLANSPAVVEEIKYKYGVNAIFCPTNTIILDDFSELSIRKFRHPINILFCGRVVPDKGIEDLLEGLGILKKKNIVPRLTIVGNVDKDYLAKISYKAKKLGIFEQLFFKGFIPYGVDLLSYYRNSDIYVLPSWHEGFPHSIWEAAANCVPIITTPVGGIPSLVSDDHVFFIKAHSPSSIAEMIFKLINQPELIETKVINAYKHVLKFTSEKCAMITAKIIQERINE